MSVYCPVCDSEYPDDSVHAMLDYTSIHPPVVHQSPEGDSGIMPCCGRTPFEAASDRMTLDSEQVTCSRSAA